MLMIAMAIVSLLAAILGVVVQHYAPEIRLRLIVFWAIWLAATTGWFAFQLRRRKMAEREAGATIMRLPMSADPSIPPSLTWPTIASACAILFLLIMANVLLVSVGTTPALSDWVFDLGMPLLLSLGPAARLAPRLLWMKEAR